MLYGECAQRFKRTKRSVALRCAAMAMGIVFVASCYDQGAADRRAISTAVPHWVAPAGMTFTVELVHKLDSNVTEAPLEAVVVAPIMAADGSTIVKRGAVVAGRATGVPGPNGRSLRLELQSIETIHGRVPLSATFAPDQRDPALAATN